MTFRRWLVSSVLAGILLATAAPVFAAAIAIVIRSGFVGPDGSQVYYEAVGTGAPVVFLSGGNWMDMREWDVQFLPIADTFHAIRFDARGYGQSDPAAAGNTGVEDLTALLDGHRLEAAHLIALSHSAATAVDFTLAHPDRVLSLSLVSPIAAEMSDKYRKREAALLNVLKRQGPEWFAEAVVKDPYFVPSGGRRRAARLLEINGQRVLATVKSGATAPAPVPARNFADIKVPTLLVLGDADDPEILQKANSIAAGIPHAKKVVMEGAGHSINLENGRELMKILKAFLEGKEELE